MEKLLTYKGAVMTGECDSNHHMNVMYYINKFEHAGRNFDIELGFFEEGRPDDLGLVVVEHQIKYLKEVFEDDLLYIESGLSYIGNKAFTVDHEMRLTRSNELASTMKATLVRFDKKNRKALPFPKERREDLKKRWKLT